MKNLHKKFLGVLLTLFILVNFTTTTYSSNYSNTFIFGEDRDKNGTVDETYGQFQLKLWCQDSFTSYLTVLITLGYVNDSLAKATYIKFVNITVLLLDDKGKIEGSKTVPNTRNLIPGEKIQMFAQLSAPDSTGTYYVNVNFTLIWSYQGVPGSLDFSLIDHVGLNGLPSTYYGAQSNGIPASVIILVIAALGAVGVGIGYLLTKRSNLLGGKKTASTGSYTVESVGESSPVQQTSIVESIESEAKLGDLKSLSSLSVLARVYFLEFFLKPIKPLTRGFNVAFETTKGVKIVKILKGMDLIESGDKRNFYFEPRGEIDTLKLTLVVIKPAGVSLEKNIKATITQNNDNRAYNVTIAPNQYYMDEKIIANFVLKRNLSNAINSLLRAISGVPQIFKEFAILTAEEILPHIIQHEFTLRNISNKTLENMELRFPSEEIIISEQEGCNATVTEDNGVVKIGNIQPGDICHLTVLTPKPKEKTETVTLKANGQQFELSDLIENLEEINILVTYSAINLRKLTKTYYAIASILRNIEKVL